MVIPVIPQISGVYCDGCMVILSFRWYFFIQMVTPKESAGFSHCFHVRWSWVVRIKALRSTWSAIGVPAPDGFQPPSKMGSGTELADIMEGKNWLVISCNSITRIFTGWWFGTFFWRGEWNNNPNWLSQFSEGLKPPTTYYINLYILNIYIYNILDIHLKRIVHILWYFSSLLWKVTRLNR